MLWWLGVAQVSWWTYRVAYLVYSHFYGVQVSTERYGKDSWAVVTGGSDGIGLACCKHLASRGFNIVLIARNIDKMVKCAEQITTVGKAHGHNEIKTRVLQFDFGQQYSTSDFKKLATEKLDGLDISILVNNVGVAEMGAFHEIDSEKLHKMLVINTYAGVLLTKEFIDMMKKRNKDKKVRSLICSTSGMISQGACRYAQTYAATKIFTDRIAHSLRYELSGYGIDVCAWRPANVSTGKLPAQLKGNMLTVTPEEFVEAAFGKCTSGVFYGHLKHEIVGVMIDQVSDILPWFGQFVMDKVASALQKVDKKKSD